MFMCLNQHGVTRRTREIHAHPQKFHAFTMIEVLVVLGVLAILAVMLLPALPRRPTHGPRIKCVNNLKNIGLAFRIYASDHNERFPWEPSSTNATTFFSPDPATYIRIVTNELSTPRVLHCPADTRTVAADWIQFTRTNLSYFISADASETFPQSFLAGDRNITNKNGPLFPGLRTLSANDQPGWDQTIHKNQGNACMGDGSVQQLSTPRLREQLRNTGQTNTHIKLSVP